MKKTCHIYLNSDDATTNSNSVIRWNLNDYTTKTRHIHSLELLNVQFPNSVYPINANNNVLTVTQGGVAASTTLTPGVYSGSTLAAHLKVVLDALAFAQTYTVTYVTAQQNLTITPSSGTFSITVGTTNNVAYYLGVADAQSGVEAATFTTSNPMNIGGPIYVDVHSNIGVNQISSTHAARVLCRIPIKVAFGDIVFYEPASPLVWELSTPSLDYLEIKLFDDKGLSYAPPVENSKISFEFLIHYQ